jgi:hypothetical protein
MTLSQPKTQQNLSSKRRITPKTAKIAQPAIAEQKVVSKRQAVVIVHGMGEQRPMATLRSFAEAVLGIPLVSTEPPYVRDAWLVPDTRAGLQELARITTRRNEQGVRTDFYELYWSDLLVNNSISTLRAWFSTLLFRWPHQVPRETLFHWLVLWILMGFIAAIATIVGFSTSLDSIKGLFKTAGDGSSLCTVMSFLLTLALIVGLNVKMLRAYQSGIVDGLGRFQGTWQALAAYDTSIGKILGQLLVTIFACFVGLLFYWFFPWQVLFSANNWVNLLLTILGLCLGFALKYIGLPIFGDVARYVSTAPDSVSARSSIRERGLKLLRALHGPMPGIRIADDSFGDVEPYQRVVLVGHSLGSIIAYDVLRLFWMERGATRNNPPDKKSTDAL